MGSSKSAKSEPAYDINQLKASYATWLKDASDTRDKAITSTTTRLSASGLKPGATLWTQSMNQIETQYQNELESIEGTETARIIKEFEKKQKPKTPVDRFEPTPEELQAVASGESRVARRINERAISSDPLQAAAASGDSRAINDLEKQAKQLGKGYYMLGGYRVNVNR